MIRCAVHMFMLTFTFTSAVQLCVCVASAGRLPQVLLDVVRAEREARLPGRREPQQVRRRPLLLCQEACALRYARLHAIYENITTRAPVRHTYSIRVLFVQHVDQRLFGLGLS